jgi:group I intron endonuclease
MDNIINNSIIQKVTTKRLAIYKAIGMLPQPEFKDKFKKETLCQQNENTQKQNLEKCLNETEQNKQKKLNDTMNDIKIVNEPENLNTTIQIKSGIYKIINKIDGKYYVGSSQNITNRWYRHKSNLKKNKHWNKYLQNAYNKYGSDNFEYVIVEYVIVSDLLKVEQIYLDECKNNPNTNYMISYDSTAPMRGKKCYWSKWIKGHTPWNKGKKGNPAWNKGHTLTEEQKQHLRLKANQQFTSEYKKKHSEYCKSTEHCNKISNGKKDKTIFTFKNEKTGDIFTGCKYDWYMTYFGKQPCNFWRFMSGNQKTIKDWILVS